MTGTIDWATYTRLLRELDRVRREESDSVAARRHTVDMARTELAELSDRLETQQSDLTELAYQLRIPAPRFGSQASETPAASRDAALDVSVDQALAQARRHLDTVDEAIRRLEERARQPRLLPGWSTRARNAVVYAATAGCGLVFQVTLLLLSGAGRIDAFTSLSWNFCGLPVIAFFIGYLLVGYLGKPVLTPRRDRYPWETTQTKAERRALLRAQDQAARTPRMGFVICMAMFPMFFLLWELVTDAVIS